MTQINTKDLKLICQNIIELRIKIDIYDEINDTYLDTLECEIINGTSTINAESDVRRTFCVTAVPLKNKYLTVSNDGIIWINRILKIQIGVLDRVYNQWYWYKQGDYVFSNISANYDSTTNQITINCSDLMTKLDGTKNGQLGALIIQYPAYEEDPTTGEIIKYNYIRDAIITTLTQLGKITKYEVDDIGEFKAMPDYNIDFMQYREESKVQVKNGTYMETWNAIPYDQEFTVGCNVLSILTTFRDLYPNYEMYFDVDGTFICKMIPSCYNDDIVFDNSFIQKIIISEDTSIDLTAVRNICEVWGKTLNTDYYTEDCLYQNNCYSCSVNSYNEKYKNGDLIAVKIPLNNQEASKINVNGLGEIQILDENTEKPISLNSIIQNTVYVFKIRNKKVNNVTVIYAYLLGQWQPHGINVLTNGTVSQNDYITQDNKTVKKFSKEYFKAVYNCENVEFTVIPDSPYTVQELGEILDVKEGGEYENITSDSLALARAEYENWKTSRLTDSITITTKLCPFADVNIKISYRRSDSNEIKQYVVKSISHDLSNSTTTWQLVKFYPLYSTEDMRNSGTWENAYDYTWQAVSNYTWENISKIRKKG